MIQHHPRDDLIESHRLRIHELRHSHGQQQLVQHPLIHFVRTIKLLADFFSTKLPYIDGDTNIGSYI